MDYPRLTPGTLRRRYKRFLADIALDDGTVVQAHCPNTGSMRAVNIPGSHVWLSASDNPRRKLAWTWELVELPGAAGGSALASVHTGRTNDIVEEALRLALLPELAGYTAMRREVAAAGARLDFRLDYRGDEACFVEVKQVTLRESDGHGYFPDAVSVRGLKHLESLKQLAAQGHRAVLLFCVAHTGIADVAAAAHLDPAYANALSDSIQQGVEVMAYGCEVSCMAGVPHGIRLAKRLPVIV
ncbi:DNA/RNA nuclease SfsA [Aidingimonas lacisalsi]|uniref:DNA/RNA nuclease SfsA n=1 Tax=Aidingimonas lacisalsi TaxID=2604086 RepID=UPI0011D19376|nr:DNA/RNA nuclease SfsA [Aidingimonas lacisalsi]